MYYIMCFGYIVWVYRGWIWKTLTMISLSALTMSLPKNKNAVVSNDQQHTDGRVTLTGTSRAIPSAVRRIPAEHADPRANMIAATITDSEMMTAPAITGTGSITAALTKGVGMMTAAMTGSGTLTARNDRNLDPIRDIVIGLPKTEDGKSRICSALRSSRSRCCW